MSETSTSIDLLAHEIQVREEELRILRRAAELIHRTVAEINGALAHDNGKHNGTGPTPPIASRKSGRELTAAFLAEFDHALPCDARAAAAELGITLHQVSVGSLVYRKYLKRKGDGYVRTATPFIP
jgi:hypothetical protein